MSPQDSVPLIARDDISEFVGQHFLDRVAVGLADQGLLAQVPLAARGLLRQDVALKRFLVNHLLFGCDRQPLFRSPVCF